jgi:CRP-like cAMP-binding protein
MAEPEEWIAAEPFFADLAAAQRAALGPCATVEPFAAGVSLLREGEPADRFFILLEGHVRLTTHLPGRGAAPLETLGPHDPLGWSWLVEPRRWHYDATATEAVSALVFDADCLRRAMEADHELGYRLQLRLIEVMAHRLHASRLQALDLYRNPRIAEPGR